MSTQSSTNDLEVRLSALIEQLGASAAEKEAARKAIATAIQNPLVARILNSFVGNG